MPNGFSIKPPKVKLLAGEQKAAEFQILRNSQPFVLEAAGLPNAQLRRELLHPRQRGAGEAGARDPRGEWGFLYSKYIQTQIEGYIRNMIVWLLAFWPFTYLHHPVCWYRFPFTNPFYLQSP